MSSSLQPGATAPPTGDENVQPAARIAGVLFLVTFVTSIPAVLLYDPVLNDVHYVVSAGADDRVYASQLVPRRMALLGLIGGPLLCASGIAVLFGVFDAGSVPQAIATLPEFLWELSLGIYLTARGFRQSPVVATTTER